MEERAQGAIEYLFIIGAAIIVVAIVIIMILGVVEPTGSIADDANASIHRDLNDLNAMLR